MNNARMYDLGARSIFSSDGESADCGISVGLGDGSMLFFGERGGEEGWSLSIIRSNGGSAIFLGGVSPMDDGAIEAMDLIHAAINSTSPSG